MPAELGNLNQGRASNKHDFGVRVFMFFVVPGARKFTALERVAFRGARGEHQEGNLRLQWGQCQSTVWSGKDRNGQGIWWFKTKVK